VFADADAVAVEFGWGPLLLAFQKSRADLTRRSGSLQIWSSGLRYRIVVRQAESYWIGPNLVDELAIASAERLVEMPWL
jgi:hypothetical protein